MEGLAQSSKDLTENAKKLLKDVGATDSYVRFFGDVLQCEFEINSGLNKLHQNLGQEKSNGLEQNPELLLSNIQELTRSFNQWKNTIDSLYIKSKDIPALKLDPNKIAITGGSLKALCSVQTKEVQLKEGDDIFITDVSLPNKIKVRTSGGHEGYLPTLCCVLPSPDKTPTKATERLRIQLLASWVESVKKIKQLLMQCLVFSAKKLTNDWRMKAVVGNSMPKERIGRRFRRLQDTVQKTAPNWDLTKLHNAMFSLEKELTSWNMNGTDVSKLIDTIAALDKSVLCYQMFTKQLYLYRKILEKGRKPIRVVDRWENVHNVKKNKGFRYFEMKMTMEQTETVEEVVQVLLPNSHVNGGSRNETVQADQFTSISQEQQQRFVIKCVVDPRNQKEISISEAIGRGIVDQERGMYITNLRLGSGISIPEAMNNGLIKVEAVSTTKSKEETKAMGLITIKTRLDNRGYAVKAVVDCNTGKQLSTEEAKRKGMLDDDEANFTLLTNKEKMTLEEAIQAGWVLVEYEPEPDVPEFESKIFAVNAVVDQKEKRKVPFIEAVRMGLIDRENGNYINNVTGEHIYVGEAIRRGFLKAKEVEDTSNLEIDEENKVVIERMEKIRKNVLKSLGVVRAFKELQKAGEASRAAKQNNK